MEEEETEETGEMEKKMAVRARGKKERRI
jgi:hypothetical protein